MERTTATTTATTIDEGVSRLPLRELSRLRVGKMWLATDDEQLQRVLDGIEQTVRGIVELNKR